MKKKIFFIIAFVLVIGIIFFLTQDTIIKKELFKIWNPTTTKEEKKPKTKEEKIQDEEIASSIFQDSYNKARETVEKMSLEEKIGQLFLVRYDKNEVQNQKDYYPGGYILFAKDFENHTKETIKKELENDQKINKYPLILGVDEEGGYVTRVSRFKAFRNEKFLSPKYYYDTGKEALLEETEKEKLTLLKEIGINLNLAPVADVSTNPEDFMYIRTFGRNAQETSYLIQKMVEYANETQINSCLKHFPGYGNNVDTHTGIAIDERSYESFLENDFLPFEAGIKAGVPSILVSHNIVKSMDENYPASISEKVISELRNTLKFTGIIMTDDLAMDAVKSYVENNEAATLAINAGNDMIITSDFIGMYEEIMNSVKEGKIKEETINKAVLRIIAWKYTSNLF